LIPEPDALKGGIGELFLKPDFILFPFSGSGNKAFDEPFSGKIQGNKPVVSVAIIQNFKLQASFYLQNIILMCQVIIKRCSCC
jgi:hypothetical protein